MEFLFPLLLVGMFVWLFLNLRKQKRDAEETAAMRDNLKIGDAVVTTSGLFGTVVEVDEDTVDLEIAEDVVTTWLRLAIREVRPADTDAAVEAAPEAAVDPAAPAENSAVEESSAQTETRLTKD